MEEKNTTVEKYVLKKHYFYQDGARHHTSIMVQTWLKKKFGNKFMDKDSDSLIM